jgi:hypothetical protein
MKSKMVFAYRQGVMGDHGLLRRQGGWDPREGFDELVTSPLWDFAERKIRKEVQVDFAERQDRVDHNDTIRHAQRVIQAREADLGEVVLDRKRWKPSHCTTVICKGAFGSWVGRLRLSGRPLNLIPKNGPT